MKHRYKMIVGGKYMPNTVALQNSLAAAKRTEVIRTDWDELSDWGSSEAKRIGLSKKDSEDLLLQVRSMLNDSGSR